MKKRILLFTASVIAIIGLIGLAVFVYAADSDPGLRIVGCNLSFQDNIYIKYAVNGSDLSDVKLLIWTSPQTSYEYGTQSAVLESTGPELVNGISCNIYSYSALTARMMTDDVYARAYVVKSGTAYYSAVKKYIKSSYQKNGAKTMYSLTLPKRVVRELKEDEKYDEMVDSYNEMVEDMIDELEGKETLPKYDKVTRKNELKKSELKMVEHYFEEVCDKYDAEEGGMRVSKGYEVKVKSRFKKKDGDMGYRTDVLCVVKLRGDGWKIITHPIDELSYYS